MRWPLVVGMRSSTPTASPSRPPVGRRAGRDRSPWPCAADLSMDLLMTGGARRRIRGRHGPRANESGGRHGYGRYDLCAGTPARGVCGGPPRRGGSRRVVGRSGPRRRSAPRGLDRLRGTRFRNPHRRSWSSPNRAGMRRRQEGAIIVYDYEGHPVDHSGGRSIGIRIPGARLPLTARTCATVNADETIKRYKFSNAWP